MFPARRTGTDLEPDPAQRAGGLIASQARSVIAAAETHSHEIREVARVEAGKIVAEATEDARRIRLRIDALADAAAELLRDVRRDADRLTTELGFEPEVLIGVPQLERAPEPDRAAEDRATAIHDRPAQDELSGGAEEPSTSGEEERGRGHRTRAERRRRARARAAQALEEAAQARQEAAQAREETRVREETELREDVTQVAEVVEDEPSPEPESEQYAEAGPETVVDEPEDAYVVESAEPAIAEAEAEPEPETEEQPAPDEDDHAAATREFEAEDETEAEAGSQPWDTSAANAEAVSPREATRACTACDAMGSCSRCGGKGRRLLMRCSECGGSGLCPVCGGPGYLWD